VIIDEDLERTELAWTRSALALGALGLILVKRVLPLGDHRVTEGVVILVLAVVALAVGLAYERHRRHLQLPSRSALALVAWATAGIGLAALLLSAVSG
jgi:uncharacterized membrane protein YidH (DUF202 family)